MASPPKIFAKHNRGLLLDVVVLIFNIFLMRWLTGYFLDLYALANNDEKLAQFTLSTMCVAMWALPAAGAVLKRWHFHHRLQASGETLNLNSIPGGCLFNPIFYFCLNLVLVSAIIAGVSQFLFGNRLSQSGAIFVPSIFAGLIATILQTYLIYRYFSAPKKPPRYEFL